MGVISYRAMIVAAAILAAGASGILAATKTYKKPATVPAVRVLATTGPSRVMPVPTDAQVAEATKLVRETLKDEYKGTSALKRREFARELLRQGIDTRDDAAARYVLLSDSADMAAGAGDAVTVSRAVDELAKTFQIDPIEMKAAKLSQAASAAFTREAIDGLFAACLATEAAALVDERYEPAQRLVAIAEVAAERGKRVDLKAAVAERKKELESLRTGAAEYAKARDALATTPGDPAVSLVAGRFMCLVKGDWDKGLPLLAGGDDETLRGLAVKDMENPADAGARAQVGGGWWDLSEKLTGVMRGQARRRALFWFRQAITGGLTGVSRKAVEDRLSEVQAERMREMNLAAGLVAELYDGQKCEHKRLTRIDPAIDFDFKDKPAADGMPKDNFSILWTGLLNAPQSGTYTFVIIANNGASLELDGTSVFDKDDMQYKRNGERISVRLDEGFHPFKLRFWDGTGIAKVRLLWSPPGGGGGGGETPIPAEVFCHDAGEVAAQGAAVQVGSVRR